MNKEFSFLSELPSPDFLEWDLIDKCNDMLDAVLLCIQVRRVKMPESMIMGYLEIDKGHWTRIKQRKAHFPINKLTALQQLCGNYAPHQKLAKENWLGEFLQAYEKLKTA